MKYLIQWGHIAPYCYFIEGENIGSEGDWTQKVDRATFYTTFRNAFRAALGISRNNSRIEYNLITIVQVKEITVPKYEITPLPLS